MLLLGCDPREDAPILDLRLRKGVRRNGVTLAIASARPTALDLNATLIARYAPGADGEFAQALDSALAAGSLSTADTNKSSMVGATGWMES